MRVPGHTIRMVIGLAVFTAVFAIIRLGRGPIETTRTFGVGSRGAVDLSDASAADMLANLLIDNDPEVRAAACELLAGSARLDAAAALLRRLADEHDAVRSAASLALSAALAPGSHPDKNQPEAMLAWFEAWSKTASTSPVPSLCEILADTRYLAFSPSLARRCLSCHAGREPAPASASDACRACHAVIHEQWSGTAHAQSLSHLHLPTTGGTASRPATIDFGAIRGIGCLECHDIAPAGEATTLPADRRSRTTEPGPGVSSASFQGAAMPAAPADTCIHRFAPIDPSAVCSRCHADTFCQWQQWRDTPHPRRADWPPGHLEINARGDARSCADCHMPAVSSDHGLAAREHRWPARRDAALLREGLDVRIVLPDPQTAGRTDGDTDIDSATLVLTNLAGHGYPTGTGRRALQVEAGSSSTSPLPVLTFLTAGLPGDVAGHAYQAPLAPGEQRRLTVPLPADSESVSFRITYVRNLMDPESPTTEILSGQRRRNPWMAPSPPE